MVYNAENNSLSKQTRAQLARIVFTVFLITFVLARITVFLIMTNRFPVLYLFIGGTHVHHLNYGIFLMTLISAYLLFWRPEGKKARTAAIIYGIGLALTFDEFGMWLHLGGSYWQRDSWDAILVIASLLGIIAFVPSIKHFSRSNWIITCIIILSVLFFFSLLLGKIFKVL